jgi:hypothetical protein
MTRGDWEHWGHCMRLPFNTVVGVKELYAGYASEKIRK